MKNIKKYQNWSIKESTDDPYNEEIWGDDEITKKIKEALKNKLKQNKYLTQERIDNVVNSITTENNTYKYYNIKVYTDGGPNDRGDTIGYVRARSKKEAKVVAYLNNLASKDIIFTGFFEAQIISEEIINKEIEKLEKSLNALKNIPSSENI